MSILNLEDRGMMSSARTEGFILFTHLSWTGKILVGDLGCAFEQNLFKLCPVIEFGSIAIIRDEATGRVVSATANHGDCNFPKPAAGHRLILVTSDPLDFTPRALEAMAATIVGDDDVMKLPEVQAANAHHFLARLHDIGLCRSSSFAP